MRCLALADALALGGARVTFACAAIPQALAERVTRNGHALAMLGPQAQECVEGPGSESPPFAPDAQLSDAAEPRGLAGGAEADWIVVDHYRLGTEWERAARGSARLLVIDDLVRAHGCDMLLDQNLGRSAADYAGLVPEGCRVLTGPLHALLRPEFAAARPEALLRRRSGGPVRRILISTGMADPQGATLPALESALELGGDCAIDVVLGSSAPSRSGVEEVARAHPQVTLHLDATDMALLMSAADVAIGAAGTSAWERCCLGLPTALLVLAENQRPGAEALARSGAALLAGQAAHLPGALAALAADEALRLRMIAAAAAITGGDGAPHLAALMAAPERSPTGPVEMRSAVSADSERVWLWRNDPATRAASQSHDPVPWPDHAAWFERTLASRHRRLYVAERGGRPIGVVRFDSTHAGAVSWGVSINISPAERGGGTGKAVLRAGCRRFLEEQGRAPLEAVVHRENQGSRRIFEAIGFARCAGGVGESGFERYLRPEELFLDGL